MNKKQELLERLQREFTICDRHNLRIEEALSGLRSVLPLSVETYADLNTEEIRCLDQFIFRFSKLQDAMGAKIFRYVLEYLDDNCRSELYHFIDSANEWNYIRELRNSIAHDYPLWENDIVDSLNALVAKVPVLQGIYEKLKTVVYN